MTKYGMATEKDSSSEITSARESPGSSNNGGSESVASAILITGHKLNRQNYIQWSHSVIMFICGRDKDDYLTG